MALKDHIVFFLCTAGTTLVAATWTVSEQIRISPIKAKLEAQEIAHKSSPVIKGVVVTRTILGNSLILEQNIELSDPEGDAIFVNYIVLGTNSKQLNVSSSTINASKEEQIQGTTTVGRWTCGTEKYFIKFRAIITDAGGHTNLPHDYTINCDF